jgi:CRP/FNR family transcriptional regulator
VKPDEIIFLQSDPADQVWLCVRGCLKMCVQEETGREVIPWLVQAGEPFGTSMFLLGEQRATARALTAAEVLYFPIERYEQLLAAHPAMVRVLLRTINTRLSAVVHMHLMAGDRVERRIAYILLKLAKCSGRDDPEGTLVTIPLSRQEVADMTGTTLETAIRTLSRLRSEGAIKTRQGGFLVILDRACLEQIANRTDPNPLP